MKTGSCLLSGRAVIALTAAAAAETPSTLLAGRRVAVAATEDTAAGAFSAVRGRTRLERRVQDWSRSSCHTTDPRSAGRHAVTGKPVETPDVVEMKLSSQGERP